MKTVEVRCAVCGCPVEIDEDLLKIKGASFVCSHECLDEKQYKEEIDILDEDEKEDGR
jgi:hypothetical protein